MSIFRGIAVAFMGGYFHRHSPQHRLREIHQFQQPLPLGIVPGRLDSHGPQLHEAHVFGVRIVGEP